MSRYSAWIFLGLVLVACGSPSSDNTTRREIESRDNLMKTYAEVVGVYRGYVHPIEPRDLPYAVELRLDVVEVQDGVNENREVRFRPELRGVFRMLTEPSDQIRVQMNVRYYKETREIALQSTNSGPTGSAGYQISISGLVEPGLIRGRSTDHLGRTGQVELRRIR
ncbi:MAG: hypothetical protein HUU37_07280 [Bdellovibrionales bacterium]|nr:hypothetical protein [Bdellovibrionales bacterium]